ncbi:ImmA/IrrE family metallo-endopeptidase [Phreatobacter cathodiphilus]|uniref:IrrE N-terminal-like domain-containing protein n=1 Tax=Phreatobacter cathodiphilus TaxID=1868589 RepID=A0A2S0N781_9HYPH|nr:ImmA/IrrE family metallo-endopeptidase [Phreatobacter cathodiphilus]AVO43801.1 hypothetical protein C6569_01205 [Phreatobacter cathodiphilus]
MTKFSLKLNPIGSERLSTCHFSVALDDVTIWPNRGVDSSTVEVQIDDLLSHLTEFWKPLMLRQTFPLALNPLRPSLLRPEAEKRWASKPEPQVEQEDIALEAFQECHDISRCFAGYFDLPPLWFFRSGERMLVDTGEYFVEVSYEAAREALQAAGDWIADRLGDSRWSTLVSAWKARDAGEGIGLLRWSTGLDEETARNLAESGLLTVPANVTEAANDNDEIRIAARMANSLLPEDIEAILERIVQFPKTNAAGLDALSAASHIFVQSRYSTARPFEQGEALAGFVRQKIGVSSYEYLDVFELVRKLGATVCVEAFGPSTLDAIAVWGNLHGPATLLNSGSRRHSVPGSEDAEHSGQLRVTLAHEFCHFLIDRGHALGVVDVLLSRMPAPVEQRARAFAAELLLPSRAAGIAWIDAGRPTDRQGLENLVGDLCQKYSLSKSVSSWKLEHGARLYGANLSQTLDALLPQR